MNTRVIQNRPHASLRKERALATSFLMNDCWVWGGVFQILSMQKQAELGPPVADLIRQVGISKQTFYRWKRQYGGWSRTKSAS